MWVVLDALFTAANAIAWPMLLSWVGTLIGCRVGEWMHDRRMR